MDEEDQDLIGSRGTVCTAIPGAHRPGEVEVGYAGGTQTFIAYAEEPIPKGAMIVIYEARPGRRVSVALTA